MMQPLLATLVLGVLLIADVHANPGREARCSTDPAGTRGTCQLQHRVELRVKKDPQVLESAAGAGLPPVFLTYCDGAFQPIFEVFHKCYVAAMGDGMLPHLLDLGATDAGRCHPRVAGQVSLVAGSAESRVTPQGVPIVIAKGIADQLELGRDVFRIDADAFIIQNPISEMRDRYPDADIVSSVDCAFVDPEYCGWYRTQAYWERHAGHDPLSEMGFMLNTGFVFLRSNPRTIALARDAAQAVHDGRSDFEQTALNEELVRRHCAWSTGSGPLHGNAGRENGRMLYTERFFGTCDGGLKVVVLPFEIITRATNNATGKLAMHPGGTTDDKLKTLPEVERACSERAGLRADGA